MSIHRKGEKRKRGERKGMNGFMAYRDWGLCSKLNYFQLYNLCTV
jgi:hypothetical protein